MIIKQRVLLVWLTMVITAIVGIGAWTASHRGPRYVKRSIEGTTCIYDRRDQRIVSCEWPRR